VLRKLGEDVTESLEHVPGQWKVIQHVREKFSCRSCEAITQPPAPSHPIARGRAGPNLLAHVLFSKYGLHLPLNRQSTAYAREGIELDVSTLADWVAVRNERSRPLVEALERYLREQRAKLSGKSETARAIDYSLKRWPALTRFLEDGRLCLSNNAAERALRSIAVGRHNWIFAGSDEGARRAAAIYTLIETCLCRVRHKAVYAVRRTMPSGSGRILLYWRICGLSSEHRPNSIRHSLAAQSASRNARRRSLGRKRVRFSRSYGLSFARAASLSARCACR
jgi:transposase